MALEIIQFFRGPLIAFQRTDNFYSVSNGAFEAGI
jgi:hypothetical protein